MRLRQLFEEIARTGKGKSAVVGWGRGMGHKGHMMLASSVITQAKETGADPYFVVSKTIGKDDPITPEEKLHLYKKVFPKHGHIFHVATDEMPDLNRVLTQLGQHGYTDATVIVGADQKAAFQYLVRPDKSGVEPYKQFGLKSLHVISRQETNDPSAGEEGPRATPMRDVLKDPNASDDEKFQAWRDAMSPEVSDDEVRDLMAKAAHRMADPTWGKKHKAPKKEKAVAEAESNAMDTVAKRLTDPKDGMTAKLRAAGDKRREEHLKGRNIAKKNEDVNSIKYANKVIREMRAREFIRKRLMEKASITAATPDAPYAGQGDSDDLADEHMAGLNHAVTFPSISMNKSNGSSYLQYRFGLAMAGAHPNPHDHMPIPMSTGGAFSGDPLIAPFSDQDLEIVKAAGKHIGAGKMTKLADRSNEMSDTNKISPVAKQKKNRYGI
jgi:hypothetical protein